MSEKNSRMIKFLKEFMRQRKLTQKEIAANLGINHATISRWLSGKCSPSLKSLEKLYKCYDLPIDDLLRLINYYPVNIELDYSSFSLPNFREYAHRKYPRELDDDIILMIEDLIEHRRSRRKE